MQYFVNCFIIIFLLETHSLVCVHVILAMLCITKSNKNRAATNSAMMDKNQTELLAQVESSLTYKKQMLLKTVVFPHYDNQVMLH